MAFLVGWTGGYVLVASLIAPYLRKFGCYTVPDFIGTRYGGNLARLCAVIILVVASFTYVTAQITGTGIVASRALAIPFEVGVWIGLAGILFCSMLGGMKAVTWTQVAQYIVLIIAYLLPVFWMSNSLDYGLIPQFAQFDAVLNVQELEAAPGWHAEADSRGGCRAGGLGSVSRNQRCQRHADGQVEVLHAGRLYDAEYRVSAARADALLHHPVRQGCPSVGRLVAGVHLPAVLHRAGSGNLHQAFDP